MMTAHREDTDISAVPTQAILPGLPERYKVLREIGRGGMGFVFAAFDQELDREVAIKILDGSLEGASSARERFFREAKILAGLDHKNIVKMLGYGESREGSPYYVMELLKGETLADRLSRGPLTVTEFKAIALEVVSGLEYAASKGITHRDIKPSNIFLCTDQHVRAKICDFGIARPETDTRLTSPTTLLGSPLYMSPEQCSGKTIDQRSDIYATGCVFFECLSGSPPFNGETALATMTMHINGTVPDLRVIGTTDGATQELVTLILTCLKKDPIERPQSFSALKHSLQSILNQLNEASVLFRHSKKKNSTNSRRILIGVVIASALLMAMAVIVRTISSQEKHLTNPMNSHSLESFLLTKEDLIQRSEHKLSRQMPAADRAAAVFQLCDLYRILGERYFVDHPREKGVEYFQKAKRLAPQSAQPKRSYCMAMTTEARCKVQIGQEGDAEPALNNALKIAEEIKDPSQQTVVLTAQALLYFKRKDTATALSKMKQAYEVTKEASKGLGERAVIAHEATFPAEHFRNAHLDGLTRKQKFEFIEMLLYYTQVSELLVETTCVDVLLRTATGVIHDLPVSEDTSDQTKVRAELARLTEKAKRRVESFSLLQ